MRRFLAFCMPLLIGACADDAPMRGNTPVAAPTFAPPSNAADQDPLGTLPTGQVSSPTTQGTLTDLSRVQSPQQQQVQQLQQQQQQAVTTALSQLITVGIGAIGNTGTNTPTGTNTQTTVVGTGASSGTQAPSLCRNRWAIPNSVKMMCNGTGYVDPGQTKAQFVEENFRSYAAGLCKVQTIGSAPMISYAQSCVPSAACVACVDACVAAQVAANGPFTDAMCN